MTIRRVLIIADIEGSSGCWDYASSSFLTRSWAKACAEMTRDVAAVTDALLQKGIEDVTIKDFHRTGFNLLPDWIDPRTRVQSGYALGPIPGMGHPGSAQAVLFIGLHAASGTGGFLPHTMTSRLADVRVNGQPLPEVALFASLLAPYGIRPIFFSGCPTACRQAEAVIPGISTYAIDKSGSPDAFDTEGWREGLACSAAASLANGDTRPVDGTGPFGVQVVFRDGVASARKAACRWRLARQGDAVHFDVEDLPELFRQLSRICYLTPVLLPVLPVALPLYNLMGRIGLAWVRRQVTHNLKTKGR